MLQVFGKVTFQYACRFADFKKRGTLKLVVLLIHQIKMTLMCKIIFSTLGYK